MAHLPKPNKVTILWQILEVNVILIEGDKVHKRTGRDTEQVKHPPAHIYDVTFHGKYLSMCSRLDERVGMSK